MTLQGLPQLTGWGGGGVEEKKSMKIEKDGVLLRRMAEEEE